MIPENVSAPDSDDIAGTDDLPYRQCCQLQGIYMTVSQQNAGKVD